MARAKGRDIVVELMDAVEKLQATSAEHSSLLAEMAKDAINTSAHLTALTSQAAHTARRTNELSQRMDDLSQRMDDLSQRMDDLSQRMDDLAQRMDDLSGGMATSSRLMGELSAEMTLSAERLAALEGDAHRAAENATRSAELARNTQLGLGEVARLLGRLAQDTGTRFDSIETRLGKLERKVG